jgi:hypothetical protein
VNAASGPARALGYRLLGSRLDYLLHLRPAEWPIMAGHTLLGALLALGLARAASGDRIGAVLLGLVLWVVALNGGTLAINSAFDRDEGDVAYLRRPPVPPPGLFGFGLGLMVAGLFISCSFRERTPGSTHVLHHVGALLRAAGHSRPSPVPTGSSTCSASDPDAARRLGEHREPLTIWGWFCVGLRALFAGLCPLTQLYQFDEDERRGDRHSRCCWGSDGAWGCRSPALPSRSGCSLQLRQRRDGPGTMSGDGGRW